MRGLHSPVPQSPNSPHTSHGCRTLTPMGAVRAPAAPAPTPDLSSDSGEGCSTVNSRTSSAGGKTGKQEGVGEGWVAAAACNGGETDSSCAAQRPQWRDGKTIARLMANWSTGLTARVHNRAGGPLQGIL